MAKKEKNTEVSFLLHVTFHFRLSSCPTRCYYKNCRQCFHCFKLDKFKMKLMFRLLEHSEATDIVLVFNQLH